MTSTPDFTRIDVNDRIVISRYEPGDGRKETLFHISQKEDFESVLLTSEDARQLVAKLLEELRYS